MNFSEKIAFFLLCIFQACNMMHTIEDFESTLFGFNMPEMGNWVKWVDNLSGIYEVDVSMEGENIPLAYVDMNNDKK